MLELIRARQSYPQDTKDAVPTFPGRSAGDQPWTEQWFDVHPLGDSPTPDGSTLLEYLARDSSRLGRASVMTFGHRLPFPVKVLSAASPPSLQAHPTQQQACDGHTRRSLMGIPLGTPERSFRDDWPRPETIVALTLFEAPAGFRDPLPTAQLLETLEVGDTLASVIDPLCNRTGSPILQEVFLDVLSLDDRCHLIDEVLGAAVNHLDAPDEFGVFVRTAVEIDKYFPPDPDILAVLLPNRFSLEPGQVLALLPSVVHSCLRGICIEVMASPGNVLRSDLTGERIDVDALPHVVDLTLGPGDVLPPSGSDGTYIYPTNFEEFELWPLQPIDEDTLQVPRRDPGKICLVASESLELTGDGDPVVLKSRYAAFVAVEETVVARGEGQLFVVAVGV